MCWGFFRLPRVSQVHTHLKCRGLWRDGRPPSQGLLHNREGTAVGLTEAASPISFLGRASCTHPHQWPPAFAKAQTRGAS